MKIARPFIRALFVLLSAFFMAAYMTEAGNALTTSNALIGALIGIVYGGGLIGLEYLFRHTHLRTFNVAVIGLFFGYLLGAALVLILKTVISITTLSPTSSTLEILKIAFYLFGTYMGIMLAVRSADELYISIPFIRFSPMQEQGNDLILDLTTVADTRFFDLAASGLLDRRLILPRFVIKELYSLCQYPDEAHRNLGREGLEGVKKLEELPSLEVRVQDTDFPETKELLQKLVRLARLLNANILSADPTPAQLPPGSKVRMVNLNTIANALKPAMQGGESFIIRIQRYGKEPMQGVGYLEDGAMVVVNGGGDYIGEDIKVRVLSVKHTTAGRIIFCNVADDEDYPEDYRNKPRQL